MDVHPRNSDFMDAHPRNSVFMDSHPRDSDFMEQNLLLPQDTAHPIQEILGCGAFPGNPQEHGRRGLASLIIYSRLIQGLKPGLGFE